ncbi:MAG: IgGFc-binding protein [Myxococcota bacterium]
MKSSVTRILFLALFALVAGATGCSSCDDNTGGSNNGIDCPDGIIVDGECIRGGSDAGDTTPPMDVEDSTDPEDTTDDTQAQDTEEDTGPDIDGECIPFDSRCASTNTYETCDTDGEAWSAPQDCPSGEVCNDGICVVGEQCEPGDVYGCRSPNSQRVCASDGVSYEERMCPTETPNCFDGECIAGQCLPDAIFCDGQDLKQCNSAGDGSTVQETCENGCLDGACLEPPDNECGGKGYIGCDFWAVDLDNYEIPCTTDSDCRSSGTCGSDGVCEGSNANAAQFAITVSNTTGNAVDVEVFDGSNNQVASETVQADALTTIELPRQDVRNTILGGDSFRISASGPITVHQFNPKSNAANVFSNDASLLLPSNALGSEYLILGWPSMPRGTGPSRSPDTFKAYVTVVASEDGDTSVTVNTPVAIQAGTGVSAIPAGSTETFSLSKGDVLQLAVEGDDVDPRDPTGMTVSADQNVAVFVGNEASYVPHNAPFADHMEQQIYPTNTWGTEYVVSKFYARGTEPDVYRVTAAQDGTTISTQPAVSGADGETINRGEVLEFSTTEDFVLTGSQPIALAQFMVGSGYPGPSGGCDPQNGDEAGCAITTTLTEPVAITSCSSDFDCTTNDFLYGGSWECETSGSNAGTCVATCSNDGNCQSISSTLFCPTSGSAAGKCSSERRVGDPAFLLNVPSTQFRSDYFVLTPTDYAFDYLNFVFEQGTTITLDGASVGGTPTQIGNTNWRVLRVPVDPGPHKVTASNPIGLSAYGYKLDVSYAYPGGLDLEVAP